MPSPLSKKRPRKPDPDCCESPGHAEPHPDHSGLLPRLSRARGQMVGIEKMIAEQRYCVDILVQCRAAMAALRSIEVSIFESHLQHCVSSALRSKDRKEIENKTRELTELLTRRTWL